MAKRIVTEQLPERSTTTVVQVGAPVQRLLFVSLACTEEVNWENHRSPSNEALNLLPDARLPPLFQPLFLVDVERED